MRLQDSRVLSICLAITAFAVLYAMAPPGPRYYPLEGLWRMAYIEGEPSMGWYARFGYAAGAAMLGWLAGRFVLFRSSNPGEPAATGLIHSVGAATVLVLLGAAGYMIYHEFVFTTHS